MRNLPSVYRNEDRINYLCLVAERVLGVRNLSHMPVLLSNFDSMLRHGTSRNVELAIRNLRLMGLMPTTRKMLSLLVSQYNDYHRRREAGQISQNGDRDLDRRYEIGNDFSIAPLWGAVDPDDVLDALAAISAPLPYRPHSGRRFADPSEPAYIRTEEVGGYNGYVEPLGFEPPEPPLHDLARISSQPGMVTFKELIEEARRLDTLDEQTGRRRHNDPGWESRLVEESGDLKAELLTRKADGSGLEAALGLDLSGVKHLIGLPGSGKTTILVLLASVLATRGLKALFLFPSIEVSSVFVETLWRYGVDAGILYGQSPTARSRHMGNLAQGLGSQDGGFGRTRSAARLFASNCALAACSSLEETPFPHLLPPCRQLFQPPAEKKPPRRVLCALSAVCGRNAAPRELTTANIWAGHVISTDSRIPPHYCAEIIRYFELVARTFDAVIFDEADAAQVLLDENGASVLDVYGARNSMTQRLLEQINVVAASGDNNFLSEGKFMNHLMEFARFEAANFRLINFVQNMRETEKNRYQHQLLTTARLFPDLYPVSRDVTDEEQDQQFRQQYAIERLWVESAKRVVFVSDTDEDDDWEPPVDILEVAHVLAKTEDELRGFTRGLSMIFRRWENAQDFSDYMGITREGLDYLEEFWPSPAKAADAANHNQVGLLTMFVTFVIIHYIAVAPLMRVLATMGLLDEDVFHLRPSSDLLKVIPENLLGRLSGVRYSVQDEGRVQTQYVTFSSTPRALLYRFGDLYRAEGVEGPAVLLSSATSFLEDSPSFHVPVEPNYLLKRLRSGEGWRRSRYKLLALTDPKNPGGLLRFSGSPYGQRERILIAMVDRLLEGAEASPLLSSLNGNDIQDDVGRKVGLVVNSYEQVETIMDHVIRNHRDVSHRFKGLARRAHTDKHAKLFITSAQVESLGALDDWDFLVFPMGAIGRGVNIVYQAGPRKNDAMIGSLFFLTRPHPSTDSLQFLQGIAGSASMEFDSQVFDAREGLDELVRAYKVARYELSDRVSMLLHQPLAVSKLGTLARPFVADNMIQAIQTIGRAMRNDCPCFVYFVDAAWAPRSMAGGKDNKRTSMLVMIIQILEELTSHTNAVHKEVYHEIYMPFLEPLKNTADLSY